jgi:hypothetical protein
MGFRCADHVIPSIGKKFALTSPTSGGRSVAIVRSRTKATEAFLFFFVWINSVFPCTAFPTWLHPFSVNNKLLVYKTTLKPICVYSIQLWRTASSSNIETLERFQLKTLRMITDAPWYVPNTIIRKDLQSPTVEHEISRYSYHYSKCLSVHPNELILNLQVPPETRRLPKNLPIDLPTRFNM